MALNRIIDKASRNIKTLFLIDGLGALTSAFLLGVILVRLEEYMGVPPPTFYFLAIFPLAFLLYDLVAYRQESAKAIPLLKGIAVLNVSYCLLSVGAAFYHFETITLLGWAYILGEVVLVSSLALIEQKAARRAEKNLTQGMEQNNTA